MLDKEKKGNGYKTMDLVEAPHLPKYEYQKPEYGFGSLGGKQSKEAAKEPKKPKKRAEGH